MRTISSDGTSLIIVFTSGGSNNGRTYRAPPSCSFTKTYGCPKQSASETGASFHLTLVPATGGGVIFTPQCSFSPKSPTKQWIKPVSFRDIVTDPFGFLMPLSVSLYLLPVLRGRSVSNVHETGFPTIQQ